MTGTIDASALADATGETRALSRHADEQTGRRQRQISQVPYLPGLDGIRAVAVVAVMIYHANSGWLAGGYLGVEVFFVISGYLITLLLIAEHERSGTIDLKNFWIRRFRRLLPALFMMMLLLSVWVALFESDALGKLRGDVIAGASYFSNWYQIWIGAGYSAGNDFAPLRHLWSLAVEEQFYIVWPLVMVAFVKFGPRKIAGVARWLFLGTVVLTVIVALLDYNGAQQSVQFTPDAYWTIGDRAISKPDALYLSTISRAGGLMLGAAFAMVWRPTAIMRSPLRTKGRLFDIGAGLGFGVLGIMAWYVSFQPSEGVHGFLFKGGLFLTGIATLAIIAAVTHQGAITGRLLSTPVLLWIGTRSYGLYLYHWPIYQIIRNIAANKLQFHEFVLAMVATAIITEASYRFVETPIRQGRLSELWKRRSEMGRGALGGRGAAGGRRAMSDGQRKGAIAGAFVGTALFVYAGASMATAELKLNSVEQGLEEAAAFTCDPLIPGDCARDTDEPTVDDPAAPPTDTTGGEAPANSNAVGEPAADGSTPVVDEIAVTSTTEPPTPSTLLAVGDSVMLGAAQQLNSIGFDVSAIESRSWINGLDFVQRLEAAGQLPQTLLIHLGTNGPISQSEMDQMMTAVATVPRVILMTNDVDRDYTVDNNSLIIGTASQYANVEFLDWQGLISDCPGDCLESDGFHLKPDGRKYYADVVAFTINN